MADLQTPRILDFPENPSAEFDYFYRDGMPLRPSPKPGTDKPAWSVLRHTMFDRWHTVSDEWDFDTEQTRLLDDHMWQEDELMSRVVAMFGRVGAQRSRAMVNQALEHGIDSVENPEPELVELFAQLDAVPAWFNREQAERGRIVWNNVTETSHKLSVGFALWATSMEDRTSAATGATKMFEIKPLQRGVETATFFASTGLADTFDRFSTGFKSTVRVRLVHAQANMRLRRAWGEEHFNRFGPPISSGFLVGGEGWFAVMPLAVDEIFGRPHSDQDWDDVAMYWAYILYLLGVEERIIPKTGEDMRRMTDYIFAHAGEPNNYRQQMANTLFHAIERSGRGSAEAMAGALSTLVGPEQAALAMKGTDWENANMDLFARLFTAKAQGEALTARLIDEMPEAAAIHAQRAHDGNPPWMEDLLRTKELVAAAQEKIEANYDGHDLDNGKPVVVAG